PVDFRLRREHVRDGRARGVTDVPGVQGEGNVLPRRDVYGHVVERTYEVDYSLVVAGRCYRVVVLLAAEVGVGVVRETDRVLVGHQAAFQREGRTVRCHSAGAVSDLRRCLL